jgi:cell division protease FtsH
MKPKKPQLPLKGSGGPSKSNKIRTVITAVLVVIVIAAVGFSNYNKDGLTKDNEVSFSSLVTEVKEGKISKIKENGQKLLVTTKEQSDQDKPSKYAVLPVGASATEQGLDISKVEYTAKTQSEGDSTVLSLLINLGLPILIFVGFFYFISKQAGNQGNQAAMFGKSKAKLYGGDKKKVKFSEVAGNEHAKEDLQEVVEFLKFPKRFQKLGAKIPKGVLLVGSPGTGKTMLAKAVAGEAEVPFFSISGSEFVEMFVGVGASRVRDLFAKAKKNSPCIIFIDEIDAVGRKRGTGTGGGHDEREQTLNQILVEMDGFEGGENVIVLAATNRADVLDPALLRPGRFDRRVHIPLPDRQDREEILKINFEGKPLDSNVNIKSLSKKTTGMSGADLANLANESAILAARRKSKTIHNRDAVEAFERVAIGPERKNKILNEKDQENTAYHEGGHALVGHVLPDADPVHKVTIIPRGGTGGVTWSLSEEERSNHDVKQLKDSMARLTAGRLAEEIIYGRQGISTGAGNDLVKATDLAKEMIIGQGMASNPMLRDIAFEEDKDPIGGGSTETGYSEKTAELIDEEIRALVQEASRRALKVLTVNKKYLEAIKVALLEKETLDEKEIVEIFKGAKLPKEVLLT